jgi:hypothetical protein
MDCALRDTRFLSDAGDGRGLYPALLDAFESRIKKLLPPDVLDRSQPHDVRRPAMKAAGSSISARNLVQASQEILTNLVVWIIYWPYGQYCGQAAKSMQV